MSARILVDLSVAPPGGAATYVEGFARGVIGTSAGKAHDLVVLVDADWAGRNDDLVSAMEDAGARVAVEAFPAPGTWRARLTRGRRLAAVARREKVDVAFFPRDVAPSMPVPYVTLARNLYAWESFGSNQAVGGRLSSKLLRWKARRSTSKAAGVLAVSRPMAAVVDGTVHGVVHHGCLLPEHEPTAREPGSAMVVALVANLIESKGVDVAVRAVAELSRERDDLVLKVYGRRMDEAYAAEVESLSRELLGRSVLEGPRYGDDLVSAYHDADVVVVGSAFESFCHPLVEAMRSGCAVVAPACELVEELCGDVAATYRQGDRDDMARALAQALDEREERTRSGLIRARAFTWEATVEKTLAFVAGAVEPQERSTPSRCPRAVSVLWSRPSLYLTDCLDALGLHSEVRSFYSHDGTAGVDQSRRRSPSDVDRRRLLDDQTEVLIVGSWTNRDYLRIAFQARRRGVATVLAFDTQMRSDLLLRIQARVAGVVLSRLFTHVMVPGDRQAATARALGFAPDRIFKGLYACRQDHCPSATSQPSADAEPTGPAFLWVGRLVEDKDVELLVKAYSRYRAAVEGPWPLRVIGRGPLKVLVDGTRGGTEGIDYLGAMGGEEVHDCMEAAACLLSTSSYEPWGMVLAEAATHRLPIICTTAAGAGDHLVEEGISGHVVASGDAAAFARAMVSIHSLAERERREMGQRSRELGGQFTPELWARQVCAIHESVVGTAP